MRWRRQAARRGHKIHKCFWRENLRKGRVLADLTIDGNDI